MRRVLMIFRASPAGGIRAREGIDAALLFSAFTPQLAILFSGDAVWQLVAGQQPDVVGAPAVAAAIGAFDEYDIHELHVDGAALAARGIEPAQLAIPARIADDAAIRELLATHDHVLTF